MSGKGTSPFTLHGFLQIWRCQIFFIIFGIAKFENSIVTYTKQKDWGDTLRTRKLELGEKNIVGVRVTEARLKLDMKQVELLARLQTAGIDISIPALSLLEGQKRPVTDRELNALAEILDVTADWLLGRE